MASVRARVDPYMMEELSRENPIMAAAANLGGLTQEQKNARAAARQARNLQSFARTPPNMGAAQVPAARYAAPSQAPDITMAQPMARQPEPAPATPTSGVPMTNTPAYGSDRTAPPYVDSSQVGPQVPMRNAQPYNPMTAPAAQERPVMDIPPDTKMPEQRQQQLPGFRGMAAMTAGLDNAAPMAPPLTPLPAAPMAVDVETPKLSANPTFGELLTTGLRSRLATANARNEMAAQQAEISARGQDVAARGQDVTARGQDVSAATAAGAQRVSAANVAGLNQARSAEAQLTSARAGAIPQQTAQAAKESDARINAANAQAEAARRPRYERVTAQTGPADAAGNPTEQTYLYDPASRQLVNPFSGQTPNFANATELPTTGVSDGYTATTPQGTFRYNAKTGKYAMVQ